MSPWFRSKRSASADPLSDPKGAGVSDAEWSQATAHCHPLVVKRVVEETPEARSLVLEIPDDRREVFHYRAGQFLSFKIPCEGKVLVRSYSLSSSPHTDDETVITIKRIEAGRVSNWINDRVREGSTLWTVPPAGFFVLTDSERRLVFFAAGSGITPVYSLVKSALASTRRRLKLVYANRDEASIIFRDGLDDLVRRHPDRLEVLHSLDDRDGYLDAEAVTRHAEGERDADFYLCGPSAFMDVVEGALLRLGVPPGQVHIERFESPPDPGAAPEPARVGAAAESEEAGAPESIEVELDGRVHAVPYREGERVLAAARRAGLDPPFSCEEGYCSCCMAKLVEGRVEMAANDCLTPELLGEGWILTCQSRCTSRKVRIAYPD